MFYLNEVLLKEEMPARARRLFIETFRKYHKLDGGDENIALHLAFKAVERRYVKLNNRWIPKSAAEEIVRHDIDEESEPPRRDEERVVAARGVPLRRQQPSRGVPLRRQQPSRAVDSRRQQPSRAVDSRRQQPSRAVDAGDDDDESLSSDEDGDEDEEFRPYGRPVSEDEDEHEAVDRAGRKRKRPLSPFD
uniref:ChaB-like peptide n=1 Tax=Lymantria dispar multicapsid nuclear polyhedrosis virus TaxID=10449 RepID=A0A0A0YVU3_NPVLD|nr:ChaB-like peptide [Lymantria dispar multiple nucleopolyhedrovirus]